VVWSDWGRGFLRPFGSALAVVVFSCLLYFILPDSRISTRQCHPLGISMDEIKSACSTNSRWFRRDVMPFQEARLIYEIAASLPSWLRVPGGKCLWFWPDQ
jgi:hypothetical protein